MYNTNITAVTSNDLPALYKAADKTSLCAQKDYLSLLKIDLGALLAGAFFTAISVGNPNVLQWFTGLGALLLVVSLSTTVVVSVRKFEQQWYGGRAIAESAKTLSWKYMCGAEPFEVLHLHEETDRLFRDSLQDVLKQAEQLSVRLSADLANQPQITEKMRLVRSQSLEQRKQIYLEQRIIEQRDWYRKKASLNQSREQIYFIAIIVAKFLAIAFSVILIVQPVIGINLPSVLSALAAALLAWMQVKRHQEHSQSYNVAAHELGLIIINAPYVESEKKFAEFVADAEAAISREHTSTLR